MICRMYELYKTTPADYQIILKEAIRLTSSDASIEDAFFAYAKERIGLSPRMLTDYLQKAADYCHLKQPLLGMTDVKDVRNVQQKVAEGNLLRFRYGKDAQTIRNVTQLYYIFIKSYREPKEELPVQEGPAEEKNESTQSAPGMDMMVAEPTSDPQITVIVEGSEKDFSDKSSVEVLSEDATKELFYERFFVDFSQDKPYLFTKPVSYTYRGVLHDTKSWNRLYVEVCGLLWTDCREAFMSVMNGDIPGHSALAFADEENYRRMRVPKIFSPGCYLESNLDATSIVRKLCGLHQLLGLTDELQIEYRAVEGYRLSESKVNYEIGATGQIPEDSDYDWQRRGLLLVDLSREASYAFTQPEAYEYKGVTRRVNKWGKLYADLCSALFEDYQDAFMGIMNGDIPGYSALAFADEQHKSSMRVARCFAPGFYLESNIDATTIVRRIRGLYRLFELGDSLRVSYTRQGGSITPGARQKLHVQKTITETVFDVLRQAGKPMSVSEIYQAIIRDDLYSFGAQDPKSVVYSKVSLACRQIEDRIKKGRDVLISSEANGRKVFQVMSAKEATAYLRTQQRETKLETASPWTEYEAVLKQTFPKGFQKESGLDMKKLRKRWAEIHGEELKDFDDTVRLQMATYCVDTGKRWYLAELLLSDEDRQTVLRYIDRVLGSGKSVIYYSSIYAALEHQLESTVLTEDLLVSYLQATCQDRYIFRESYLTNDRNAQVNLSEEIKDVMMAHGRPIHTDELKQVLHHLSPDQVERELHIHSEFITDASHRYFHESMADLTEQELDQIAAFIQEELDEQGYMIGNWIQRKLARLYPETAERLSFLTLLGVRGAVAYKLRDRFTFSGPVITPRGKTMNMIDIFAMFCRRHTPFTLDELAAFAKECDSTIYLDTVHRNAARVSEKEFVATGAVRWDIPHIDAAIALHCPGKYVSLKRIQYFDAFPYVGYSWNSYLLEQYVATVSKDFTLMHSSYAKNNTSGAIVRWNAGFESFDEVLADILANAPVDLEKDSCMGYLVDAGYITRRKLSNINEVITRAKMLRSQKG